MYDLLDYECLINLIFSRIKKKKPDFFYVKICSLDYSNEKDFEWWRDDWLEMNPIEMHFLEYIIVNIFSFFDLYSNIFSAWAELREIFRCRVGISHVVFVRHIQTVQYTFGRFELKLFLLSP